MWAMSYGCSTIAFKSNSLCGALAPKEMNCRYVDIRNGEIYLLKTDPFSLYLTKKSSMKAPVSISLAYTLKGRTLVYVLPPIRKLTLLC